MIPQDQINQFMQAGNDVYLAGKKDTDSPYKHGAKQAFDCFMSVTEYNIPKLARTEVQPLDSDGNKSDGFKITVEHVSK